MKHKFRRYLKLYTRCMRISFSAATAYRFNFVLGMIIMFAGNIMFPLVTILIYGSGSSFPGWSFWQVLLIQSIFTISTGIANTFFNGIFWQTNIGVREGSLEIIFLKPVSPLFYMAANSIDPQSTAYIFGGFVMFGLAISHIESITIINLLNFLLFSSAGILVMLGITLIMSATAFKWIGNSRIPEIFDSVKQFAKYPMTIFPKIVNSLSTFIIPVAMVAFIPAEAIMGNIKPIYYLAIIPCIIFLIIGFLLYRLMVRFYESVGG